MGQGDLACCSPSGCKESDTTGQLNNNGDQLTSFSPLASLYDNSVFTSLFLYYNYQLLKGKTTILSLFVLTPSLMKVDSIQLMLN